MLILMNRFRNSKIDFVWSTSPLHGCQFLDFQLALIKKVYNHHPPEGYTPQSKPSALPGPARLTRRHYSPNREKTTTEQVYSMYKVQCVKRDKL